MRPRTTSSSDNRTRVPLTTRAIVSIVSPSPRTVTASSMCPGTPLVSTLSSPSKLVMNWSLRPLCSYLSSARHQHMQIAHLRDLEARQPLCIELAADLLRRIGGTERVEKILPQQ